MSRDGRSPISVEAAAARGTVLFGVLFHDTATPAPETVVLAITGIHGNFYSNPFYVDFGAAVNAAGDWLFSDTLDNVHPEPDGDFSQVSRIRVPGGLLIGSLDVFAGGEPVAFLRNLAEHFPDPARNRIVVIPGTGHTYQGKARETAEGVAVLHQHEVQKKSSSSAIAIDKRMDGLEKNMEECGPLYRMVAACLQPRQQRAHFVGHRQRIWRDKGGTDHFDLNAAIGPAKLLPAISASMLSHASFFWNYMILPHSRASISGFVTPANTRCTAHK